MSIHHAATYSETIYHAVDVLRILPFAFIGLVMVAGWRDSPKPIKKTTRRRKATGQRPPVKAKKVKDRAKAKTWHIAPPLSDWEDRILADYFVKRNFVML